MSRIPQVSLKRGTQKQSRKLALDIQQQLNAQPQSISILDGVVPTGLKAGDRVFQRTPTGIAIGISDAKGNTNPVVINQTTINSNKAPQSGAGAPSLTQFPNPGDFGWYTNTSNSLVYFVSNIAGTVTAQSIATLTGSITFAQHGNLSGSGNAHNFTDITGTITDAQHGALTNGNDHAVVTHIANGFMAAADKIILDAATSSGTASTLVLRDASGNINGQTINAGVEFHVSSVRVVNNRVTGWGAPTGTISRAALILTANAAYVQADFNTLIQSVKAIITDLTAHGLIGP